MLISGLVTVQDYGLPTAAQKRPLKSWLMTKKVGDAYVMSLKNTMYPAGIDYQIANLERVHNKFVSEGKLSLLFKQPKHMVAVKGDDVKMLKLFMNQLQSIVSGKDVKLVPVPMPKVMPPVRRSHGNYLDPMTTEFVASNLFDQRILNMRHLNKLVLEECCLPRLPEQIGYLPIVYLSMSGSRLRSTQYDRDTFWDWMAVDKISRTMITLKMDSVGLQILPFEIMFLQNLQTLSVNKNRLTYIPHYLGELKKLHTLFVANNKLNYFPDSLFTRTFVQLDISNNPFIEHDSLRFDHICKHNERSHNICTGMRVDKSVVKPLSHLCFNSLLENCVKFKRQDIPRTLWHYFNVVGRCVHCENFILPDYTFVRHITSFPEAHSLIKSYATVTLQWQSLICRFKCSKRERNPEI